MDEALLELFELVKQDFVTLPIDEFTKKVRSENNLYFYHAFAGTPLFSDWNTFENLKQTVINENYPSGVREDAHQKLKYAVDEIIAKIKSGSLSVERKRIAESIVNTISDPKIKQICLELNNTPASNVLSLMQGLGEALKWTLNYRAKQVQGASPIPRHKIGDLGPLLADAINVPYYSDSASQKFLETFKNNFLKAFYDSVRHDAAFIPDIVIINNATFALEKLLSVTFP